MNYDLICKKIKDLESISEAVDFEGSLISAGLYPWLIKVVQRNKSFVYNRMMSYMIEDKETLRLVLENQLRQQQEELNKLKEEIGYEDRDD